uniref:Tify domain-containing protein n=1 Tax=Aegilops tauschii TaxID=37682 RepID=M8D2M0_AEGTA
MAAASRSAPEWWRDGGSVDDGGAEVELSLRLRTGSSSTARRSMTIFYNGRVVAVDVTELQAREIITMASQQILTEQQDSGGGGGGTAVAQMLLMRHYDQRPFGETVCDAIIANGHTVEFN